MVEALNNYAMKERLKSFLRVMKLTCHKKEKSRYFQP